MKKVIPFLITGILVIGAVGCQDNTSQTSSLEKPGNTTESAQTPVEPASPVTDSVTETVPKSTDDVKPDVEANAADTADTTANTITDAKSTGDIAAKLKEALPKSNLEVKEKDDNITITGTVASEAELGIVEQIVSQLKTNKAVKVEATVESPKN
ncbi:BON domain-containing protein [Moorena sp. SIO3H5]|uniref:BON domain-containing protein n=1 Tax=Moorena sp. SIO3H5 TaxID=2607834 RepID=UPI0013BB6C60|nr:BON domain-containing protein [Moorena sp. SIO3H5]NEO74697.1 BON domain-containing protein [Moorena sp. SIO3H5]